MSDAKQIIKDNFIQYSGAVLQSRALIDVRDGLKPSARQIFYCMDKYGYTSSKPIQKTLAVMGDAQKHFYIHGDSSCTGIIMRSGQPFAMRYPLIEVRGNGGDVTQSGNWAAERYTSARLSKISNQLFADIDKDTIDEWRDNYSETEQYPAVLPSKGFYNIVNGTMGIGIGLASSIPQYNIKDLNNALIYLIDHPDCSFEEIYCAPDFATGAILYNEDEVKEAMKVGHGFACKLRSVIKFNPQRRVFTVTEIPYGVYTETIVKELAEILENEDNPGIDSYNDGTGKTVDIEITLTKTANPTKVLNYLYKNTSLQSYYSINFTVLDKGRYPKMFSWKEMLQAHIDHERLVYKKGYQFDLNKILNKIHIIDGLLKALNVVDEVIVLIKNSNNTTEARKKLIDFLEIDEAQADAILNLKLAKLAHLEIEKLVDERQKLVKDAAEIEELLADPTKIDEKVKEGLASVAKKFGDERRTQIMNLSADEEEDEKKATRLAITFTNTGAVYLAETSTFLIQSKGGVGKKFKLDPGEKIVANLIGDSIDTILLFTDRGNCYHAKINQFGLNEKIYINDIVGIKSYENVTAATVLSKKTEKENIIFITKQGMVKKSLLSEYNIKRGNGVKAIDLAAGDEIASIVFTNKDNLGILTQKGKFIIFSTADIRPIGRVAKGVKGITLDDDTVASARVIPKNTKEIVSIASNGLSKRTDFGEFVINNRGAKGKRIQDIGGNEKMVDFLPICNETELMIISHASQLRLRLSDISKQSNGCKGAKTMKLPEAIRIIGLDLI